MTRKQVFLAALNKLRASKNMPRTNVLNYKARNTFLGLIEDADSYAEYGYGINTFLAQNPTAKYLTDTYGKTGEELSRLLFSIGWAQCAEDSDYESTKWEMLADWCASYVDHTEALQMTPTLKLIDSIPTGEVIPKRILAVLKRAGIIDDYSQWGYLEGDYDISRTYEYKGRYFTAKYLDGCFYPYLIKADIKPFQRIDYLQFRGNYRHQQGYASQDNIMHFLWRYYFDKVNCNYPKFYEYISKKSVAFSMPSVRKYIGPVNRKMSIYGSIA